MITWWHGKSQHYYHLRGILQSLSGLKVGQWYRALVFINIILHKMLEKHSSCKWFEMLWGSCDITVMLYKNICHIFLSFMIVSAHQILNNRDALGITGPAGMGQGEWTISICNIALRISCKLNKKIQCTAIKLSKNVIWNEFEQKAWYQTN